MTYDRDDDVKLGYKNPPPWSRFQKGRSGNPKGRPKKRSTPPKPPGESAADNALRAELARMIRVTDANGSRKLSAQELITKAQVNLAIKGNPLAQRAVLQDSRALEDRDRARKEAEDEQRRKVFDAFVYLKKIQSELWAAAARKGVEPAEPWPHPDDVHLDETRLKWRIDGPSCKSELPRYEYLRAERDRLFAQAALNRRKTRPCAPVYISLADVAWSIYDRLLPTHWRIQDKIDPWRPLDKLTTRQLQRELERLAERASLLEKRAKLPPHDKEAYRIANQVMKPLLKALGYRSLAQFEKVYETNGKRQF